MWAITFCGRRATAASERADSAASSLRASVGVERSVHHADPEITRKCRLATFITAAAVGWSSESRSIENNISRLFTGCFSSACSSAAFARNTGLRICWFLVVLIREAPFAQGSGSAARATSARRRQVGTPRADLRTRHHVRSPRRFRASSPGRPAAPADLGSTTSRSRPKPRNAAASSRSTREWSR